MTQAGPLCGFLNVLKPPGMSSAPVVGYVQMCIRDRTQTMQQLLAGREAQS